MIRSSGWLASSGALTRGGRDPSSARLTEGSLTKRLRQSSA
jgi:hypothetical protein